MTPSRSRLSPQLLAHLSAVALAVAACQSSDPSPTAAGSIATPAEVVVATPEPTPSSPAGSSDGATLVPSGIATPMPTAAPTRVPTPKPTAPPSPSPASTAHGWQPSAAFDAAKAQGRVVVDANGAVSIVASAPAAPTYPPALTLDTAWTGLMQEPPPTGVDDAGKTYRDDNYTLLCGPGAAAVVLYYWKAAHGAVTTKAGTFTEPVNVGTNRYATTTWAASDAGGNGRGMIMYLAEVAWPAPDRGQPWWKAPGMMTWSARPPSTDVWNLADAINWEASGGTSVTYFYSIVSASNLTLATLQAHVRADIAAGVPVVVAARTSNGSVSLPYWRVTSARNAANHFLTVVGYDDDAGTYTTIDTCGKGCNSTGTRSGVGHIGQAALYALIRAESDNDGIIW